MILRRSPPQTNVSDNHNHNNNDAVVDGWETKLHGSPLPYDMYNDGTLLYGKGFTNTNPFVSK